jgi:hypothetical protein
MGNSTVSSNTTFISILKNKLLHSVTFKSDECMHMFKAPDNNCLMVGRNIINNILHGSLNIKQEIAAHNIPNWW